MMMDLSDASLYCAVTIEWFNGPGISVKKMSYKMANLRLIRNEIRQMFIEISAEKVKPLKYELNGIQVHKKFMAEGKASIKFKDCKTIFLSNAPPGLLINFLKILFIKISALCDSPSANDKGSTKTPAALRLTTTTTNGGYTKNDIELKTIKKHLLNCKEPSKFDEISPITNVELNRAKKIAGIKTNVSQQKHQQTTPTSSSSSGKLMNYEKPRNILSESKNGMTKSSKSLSFDQLQQNENAQQQKYVSVESIPLNDEQQQVLNACKMGKNVFFTGSAGTGKSFLLRKIISTLPPDGTIATASTGVAACLIGGVTLHSFAGIGDGNATLQRCYELASRPVTSQTWRKCKTLIIDEISMVDAELFEKIESVARYIRRNDKPFGGIQLIICGDFFQLPPIQNRFQTNDGMQQQQIQKRKSFCFQSEKWSEVISISFELKIVHRQKDSEFIKILNHIRIGNVTDAITERLLETSNQRVEENGILATQLCSHTNDATIINESKLEKLPGELRQFKAQDQGDMHLLKQLSGQLPVTECIELKIGAQVMLMKNININDGLVNGARGVIIKFNPSNGCPVVQFKSNRVYETQPEKFIIKTASGINFIRKQIPLKLAWAFSIHKSQGLTLDCVEMSLSKVFEPGQAYVALSRAQSLQSIRILDFNAKQVWANPDVLQFYKLFRRQLHDISYIPLGGGGGGGGGMLKKRSAAFSSLAGDDDKKRIKKTNNPALTKLTNSLLNKPLVNIC